MYFTHIAASSTVTDDVTNRVMQRVFTTNLRFFYSQIWLKT